MCGIALPSQTENIMKTEKIDFNGLYLEVSYEMDGGTCLLHDVQNFNDLEILDFIRNVNEYEGDYLAALATHIEINEMEKLHDGAADRVDELIKMRKEG